MKKIDYYEAAKNLISQLESGGYAADAVKLRSAMADGATGTEILMALRFHLSEIIEQGLLTGGLRIEASQLLIQLTEALQ